MLEKPRVVLNVHKDKGIMIWNLLNNWTWFPSKYNRWWGDGFRSLNIRGFKIKYLRTCIDWEMITSHSDDISAVQAAPVCRTHRPRSYNTPSLTPALHTQHATLSWNGSCTHLIWLLLPRVCLQVCSDGLLLGPGPRGEAQVSAARSVSHRVPRSVGRLRVKTSSFFSLKNSNTESWWTLFIRNYVYENVPYRKKEQT